MLADSKVPEVPLFFLKGDSRPLLEQKWQGRQFLATQYPANLQVSLLAAPDEVTCIYVPAEDLDREADWNIANLMGGQELGSSASLCTDYGRFREVCAMVNESFPRQGRTYYHIEYVEGKQWAGCASWKGPMGALESICASNNTGLRELEAKQALKNSLLTRLWRRYRRPIVEHVEQRMQLASYRRKFNIKDLRFFK